MVAAAVVSSANVEINQHEKTASDLSSSGARKRRRQILQSKKVMTSLEDHGECIEPGPKRCCTPTSPVMAESPIASPVMSSVLPLSVPSSLDLSSPSIKATLPTPRKISHCDGIAPPVNLDEIRRSKNKRPQMRYEPDVPMTKEEAAVWRREQRRKRNRESAAASRQRQRDRITELEQEVEEWKDKFEVALERLSSLEAIYGPSEDASTTAFEVRPETVSSSAVSLENSVTVSPTPELTTSYVSDTSTVSSSSNSSCTSYGQPDNVTSHHLNVTASVDISEQHLKENSLPAVKITGAHQTLSTGSNTEIVPDQCSSLSDLSIMSTESQQTEMIQPPASPSTKKSECLEDIQRLTDEELAFDEFLMDAALWL